MDIILNGTREGFSSAFFRKCESYTIEFPGVKLQKRKKVIQINTGPIMVVRCLVTNNGNDIYFSTFSDSKSDIFIPDKIDYLEQV